MDTTFAVESVVRGYHIYNVSSSLGSTLGWLTQLCVCDIGILNHSSWNGQRPIGKHCSVVIKTHDSESRGQEEAGRT